jgi:hypothetical protein
MPSKAQLIDGILQLNPSASKDWLDLFDVAALRRYLDHLQHALEPRGGQSVWLRDAETPAVVTRRPAA